MNRLARAAVVITAAIAFAIVWAITLIGDASFIEVIRQPEFWLVESAAMAIGVFVVLSESGGHTMAARSPVRRVATQIAWTAVAALTLGSLLAIATDTPVGQLVVSIEFLVPAGILLAVAALEAWPTDRTRSR